MYIIKKVFLTINQAILIGKKEFVNIVFNLKHKIFIINIAFSTSYNIGNCLADKIFFFCIVHIITLVINKDFTLIFIKYSNIQEDFFLKLAFKIY